MKNIIIIVSSVVILLSVFIISLTVGEIQIKISDFYSLFGNDNSSIGRTILINLRIPRSLLGIAVGGSLGLSGVLLQGVYRNPLVEPYTLGISGGAAVGVAIGIISGLHVMSGSIILPITGFVGALLAMTFVYISSLYSKSFTTSNMLLSGVMFSFISSAAMMLILATTNSENLHSIIFWTMGSLDESNHVLININVIVAFAGLGLSYLFVKPLNALRLGEVTAKNLGINTTPNIRYIFIISSLLTGVSVSVAGIIGFVGLIIPHFARQLVGGDYKLLLFTSFVGGAIFVVACDTLAKVIISPNELPIGVISGILGGILFVFIINKSKNRTSMIV